MDLGAYRQIEDWDALMKANHIDIPRLRGLRYMATEERIPDEAITQRAKWIGLWNCEGTLRQPHGIITYRDLAVHEYSSNTNKKINKHFIFEEGDFSPVDVNWSTTHGRLRKIFKYKLKQARKRVDKEAGTFNKYVGRRDVLYIHARIGGNNWKWYGGDEIAKQPWFLEKVDDAFDSTYCDIYAQIIADHDYRQIEEEYANDAHTETDKDSQE